MLSFVLKVVYVASLTTMSTEATGDFTEEGRV